MIDVIKRHSRTTDSVLELLHFKINARFGRDQKALLVILYGYLSFIANRKFEIFQQIGQANANLHFAETQANAIARTIAEGQPFHAVPFFCQFWTKIIRIKLIGIVIVVGIAMHGTGGYEYTHIFLDDKLGLTWYHKIVDGNAQENRQHRIKTQSFCKKSLAKLVLVFLLQKVNTSQLP